MELIRSKEIAATNEMQRRELSKSKESCQRARLIYRPRAGSRDQALSGSGSGRMPRGSGCKLHSQEDEDSELRSSSPDDVKEEVQRYVFPHLRA